MAKRKFIGDFGEGSLGEMHRMKARLQRVKRGVGGESQDSESWKHMSRAWRQRVEEK